MSNQYSKGSTWRRWEPHIHTPGTIKNDEFKGSTLTEKWTEYIKDINNYSLDVVAVAVTDYLSHENYLKFIKAIADGEIIKRFDMVFPNIELRITPVTGEGSAINIHCIFNPDFVDKLQDRFYSKLKYHYQTRDYLATKTDLIALGKKYKNDYLLDEETAYKEGIKIFVPSIEHLKKLLEEDIELKDNCVVVVSNKSNDGVSGLNAHSEIIEGVKHSTLDGTVSSPYFSAAGI